jgi:archaetidylinositol phosphate synthase
MLVSLRILRVAFAAYNTPDDTLGPTTGAHCRKAACVDADNTEPPYPPFHSLGVVWCGAVGLAQGNPVAAKWRAGLFVLGRFLDHFDGELARLTGTTSRAGYYLDYAAGALSYAALFGALGIGLKDGALGNWALVLGTGGAICALVAMPLNLGIDSVSEEADAIGYPSIGGFELEDGIYLLAPITWLGVLVPLFVLSGVGAGIYLLWTTWSLVRLRSKQPGGLLTRSPKIPTKNKRGSGGTNGRGNNQKLTPSEQHTDRNQDHRVIGVEASKRAKFRGALSSRFFNLDH